MPLQLPALAAWRIDADESNLIARCIGCGNRLDLGCTASAETIAHLEIANHAKGCPLDPLNRLDNET